MKTINPTALQILASFILRANAFSESRICIAQIKVSPEFFEAIKQDLIGLYSGMLTDNGNSMMVYGVEVRK